MIISCHEDIIEPLVKFRFNERWQIKEDWQKIKYGLTYEGQFKNYLKSNGIIVHSFEQTPSSILVRCYGTGCETDREFHFSVKKSDTEKIKKINQLFIEI